MRPALPRWRRAVAVSTDLEHEGDGGLLATVAEATEQLAAAERELTGAMEALNVPLTNADNELIGERMRL
ncbi:MAG: hypothetical protein AB1Z98_07630, partial [Nannocystaceae bacterium]